MDNPARANLHAVYAWKRFSMISICHFVGLRTGVWSNASGAKDAWR